ncbi:c-type cytochrome [Sphingomonas canadensis]
MACHTSGKDAPNGIGPNLWGVFGARAGARPGYRSSDALASSGLTWDRATLDRWLRGPIQFVPGSRMPMRGLADPGDRRAVIAYLRSLE